VANIYVCILDLSKLSLIITMFFMVLYYMEHSSADDLYNLLYGSDIVRTEVPNNQTQKRGRENDIQNDGVKKQKNHISWTHSTSLPLPILSSINNTVSVKFDNMTPTKKSILLSVQTPERPSLLKAMKKDDIAIRETEILDAKYDPDYNLVLEQLGFYMEDLIALFGRCPVCKQDTLRKYGAQNMPVADLICINTTAHTNSCCLWQIKTSIGGYGSYFDNNKRLLTVGSKKEGFLAHEVLGSASIKEKKNVVGYICISLQKTGITTYRVVPNKSFVLIPNYATILDNEKYYTYVDVKSRFRNKNSVQWNSKLVSMVPLTISFNKMVINTNDVYVDSALEQNPYKTNITKNSNISGRRRYKLVQA
jgi:hypothetical protein